MVILGVADYWIDHIGLSYHAVPTVDYLDFGTSTVTSLPFRRHAVQKAASIPVDLLGSHGQLWPLECNIAAMWMRKSFRSIKSTIELQLTTVQRSTCSLILISICQGCLGLWWFYWSPSMHRRHPSAVRLYPWWRLCQGFLDAGHHVNLSLG